MKLLVTGGAGYVGSHVVRRFVASGHRVVVIDNLSRGHRAAVSTMADLWVLDLAADSTELSRLTREHAFDGIVHLAGLTYVGESNERPLDYYRANVTGSLNVLFAAQEAGVPRLVFSSTCAVYGSEHRMPLVESMECRPTTPYGATKAIVERMLGEQCRARPDFGAVCLRCFNVAGCARDGSLGEDHRPETHLIPALLQTALGQRPPLTIFGDDYDTPDGTCVRDYLHVEDLALACERALVATRAGVCQVFNVGLDRGYSVREVISMAESMVGRRIPVVYGPRRQGDAPALYSLSALARTELPWQPEVPDLATMIESAWRWLQRHPRGYGDG